VALAFLLGPRPFGARDWLVGDGSAETRMVRVRRGRPRRRRIRAHGPTRTIPCASAMSSLSVRWMP